MDTDKIVKISEAIKNIAITVKTLDELLSDLKGDTKEHSEDLKKIKENLAILTKNVTEKIKDISYN